MKLAIKERVDQAKARKIRISPVHANRAGELGHPCLRYLVFLRTRWMDRLPHNVGLQYIFDEGQRIEKAVIEDLHEAGFDIIHSQKDLYWKAYNISGRIDGAFKEDKEIYPMEIKGINSFDFPKLKTIPDFLNSEKAWIKKIPGQINLYLAMENLEVGYLILRDKMSAQIHPIEVTLDYSMVEGLIKKAEAIEKHIEEGTLPDRIDNEKMHKNCPFFHICLPDSYMQSHDIEDPALEGKIDTWFETKQAIAALKKVFDPLDDDLQNIFRGQEARVGDWLIGGKYVDLPERKMMATRYWRMDIKSLIKIQEED